MTWHNSEEIPTPDTEVLAEVNGFRHNKFVVLMWTKECWWQHIPKIFNMMPTDGWISAQGLSIVRWAYIEDE